MRPKETMLAATLRIDFTVRNWARSCYVIRIKKIPHLVSTRFWIPSGLKNIYSGERIQKVPESPANLLDKCGQKVYPKRKSCKFKNIRIRVDVAHGGMRYVVIYMRPVRTQTGTRISRLGPATNTKSNRSEFIVRPVSCKCIKKNVWQLIHPHAGLSSSRCHVNIPLVGRASVGLAGFLANA